MGLTKSDSYLDVRDAIRKELVMHLQDHETFLQANEEHLKHPDKVRSSTEVEELLDRLDCQTAKCAPSHYMNNRMGYAIASAFERAVVILERNPNNCHSFLPYRIRPNHVDPIVLLFVNNNHFVRLTVKSEGFPFPPMYLTGWARSSSRPVPRWKTAYSPAMDIWNNMFPPDQIQRGVDGGTVDD